MKTHYVWSYPAWFYSFYVFYLKKDNGSSEAPEHWAIGFLSCIAVFLLLAVDIELWKLHNLPASEFELLSHISNGNRWIWVLILLPYPLNYLFFLTGNRWSKYVKRYGAYPEPAKRFLHWISSIVVITILVFFIFEIISIME